MLIINGAIYAARRRRSMSKNCWSILAKSTIKILALYTETAYKAYEKRWEIEIAVRFYKAACEFDETRVHDDYSVIGSEFCDFLSTLLTFRLINAFDSVKLLEHMTYKMVMSSLKRAKKVRVPGGDWQLIKINPSIVYILQKLGPESVTRVL